MKMTLAGDWQSLRRRSKNWNSASVRGGAAWHLLPLHRRGGLKHLRPRPLPEVRGKSPEQQYLVLTADRDFRLSRIDYVSNQGTTVASENVEKSGSALKSRSTRKKSAGFGICART
jgi:hypothetical protein